MSQACVNCARLSQPVNQQTLAKAVYVSRGLSDGKQQTKLKEGDTHDAERERKRQTSLPKQRRSVLCFRRDSSLSPSLGGDSDALQELPFFTGS